MNPNLSFPLSSRDSPGPLVEWWQPTELGDEPWLEWEAGSSTLFDVFWSTKHQQNNRRLCVCVFFLFVNSRFVLIMGTRLGKKDEFLGWKVSGSSENDVWTYLADTRISQDSQTEKE